jgi:cytochrome c oxidase assembly protein subunit 15
MHPENEPRTLRLNSYQKTALATIVATLLLVAIGGLVRAAGAGLGCPDWPRCFGSWIPPTSAEQIPPQWDASKFNVWQTWLEYSNRLVGVVIGILVIATFLRSFRYRKTIPAVFWGSLIAVILVAFQGWLGGQVVYSGLHAVVITAHMLAALALIALLVYTAFLGSAAHFALDLHESSRRKLLALGVVTLAATLVQVAIGTQVREAVDQFMKSDNPPPRAAWLASAGAIDSLHRTLALVVVGAALYLLYAAIKERAPTLLTRLAGGIALVCTLQISFGIGLAYANLPPPLQVLHLFFGTLLATLLFLFTLVVSRARSLTREAGG